MTGLAAVIVLAGLVLLVLGAVPVTGRAMPWAVSVGAILLAAGVVLVVVFAVVPI